MKVLMISGDVHVIKNIDGPFSLTLTELSKVWDHIDVLCPGLVGTQRKYKDKVHLYGVRKFLLAWDLWKLLRKNRYDLVVTHDYGLMLNGLSAYFVLKFFKIPQVSEIHHIEGFPKAVSLKEKFYVRWGKFYVRYIATKLKGIRVDNKGDIVHLLKKLKVKEERIIYLPPVYLELEKYKPLPISKKCDVLFVGRLADNKGIFTIVKAIELLRNSGLSLKTVIKGRGPLESKIMNFIELHQLQDLISLDKRNLSEAQLVELYNEARVLVCASTVEGGPRVTLEAMACEVPVVSTACGLMPEVIQNQQNGFIFNGTPEDLAEKLKILFTNQDLYQKIRQNSRNSIAPYDYSITLKNYALAYKSLIQA